MATIKEVQENFTQGLTLETTNLKSIKSKSNNKVTYLKSYNTIVCYRVEVGKKVVYVKPLEFYSRTTSKHLNFLTDKKDKIIYLTKNIIDNYIFTGGIIYTISSCLESATKILWHEIKKGKKGSKAQLERIELMKDYKYFTDKILPVMVLPHREILKENCILEHLNFTSFYIQSVLEG